MMEKHQNKKKNNDDPLCSALTEVDYQVYQITELANGILSFKTKTLNRALWVNLATATLPALALGVDPASKNIMKHPPVKSGTLFETSLISRVITQGIFVAATTITAYWIGVSIGNHMVGQTMAFCVLALSQMLRAFNQRSNTEPIWVRSEGTNPWLFVSFVVSAILMACILFIPALQSVFHLTMLSGVQWLIVIGLSVLSIIQVEVVKGITKLISYSKNKRKDEK